ncbi:DNA internalization-related competence protein ComEC/Rec2 [bacterium]|nr:DNA internalization-related competence protein ComEC/Rec2 [bacterium]
MKNKPLLFALILYGSGIVSSYCLDIHRPAIPNSVCLASGVFLLFLFLILFRSSIFKNKLGRAWPCLIIIISLSIFLFGFIYTAQRHPKLLEKDPGHILHFLGDRLSCTIAGNICLPKNRVKNMEKICVELDSIQIDDQDCQMPVKGRVMITIYKIDTNIGYGDRVSISTRLRHPAGFRNERAFNYKKHLHRKGIYAVGSVGNKEKIKALATEEGKNGVMRTIFSLREDAGKLAEQYIKSQGSAAIFKAIILGDRGGITDETERLLKRTGTIHLLAVSGLHLGFVLFFCLMIIKITKRIIPVSWITAVSGIAPYSKSIALMSLLPLCFYTILTGMSISTVRALIMIILYLIAFFFDRLRDYYTTLAWAAMIILIWKPLSIFEIDFQLTFLATTGVIFYIHHRPEIFIKYPWLRKGIDLLIISAIAVFISMPICILYFHYISPGGIVFTPLAVPFLTLFIPAGLIATLLIPINQGLSRLLIIATGYGFNIFLNMLKRLADIPWTSFPVPSPPLAAILLFYLSIAIILWRFDRRESRVAPGLGMAGLIFFIIWVFVYPCLPAGKPKDKMTVTFMDVGKGDASIIRFPSGQNIIIDGGGTYDRSFDIGENILTPYLWSQGIKNIRAVVLSHPHPDHIYGLFAILRNFPVKEVWVASQTLDDEIYREFAVLISERGARERIIHANGHIPIEPGIDIICLHPPSSEDIISPRGKNSRINNHSLVLKIVYDRISILFTGDIEKEAEGFLVQNIGKGELASTILKAPHHGSKYSCSQEFLMAVNPDTAVISTRNISWYPFPDPATIERMENIGITIYRTDKDGAVTISTDGKQFVTDTWLKNQNASSILDGLVKSIFNVLKSPIY